MPYLTWIGRDAVVNHDKEVAYRLLEEVPSESYGDENTDNMLVHGDNLEALKALLPQFKGQVKCVFIDPPYNTGNEGWIYNDNVNAPAIKKWIGKVVGGSEDLSRHDKWLSMMYPRLKLLKRLLREDGCIFITIDDDEGHYLKALCDEIFGRENFVANALWQKKYAPANDATWFSDDHDHVLVYAKDKTVWRPNKLKRRASQNKLYKNPDDDPRGEWASDNYTCNKNVDERPNLYYPITNPNTGEEIWPKKTAVWRYNEETHKRHVEEGRVWWGKNGTNKVPRYKRFLADIDTGTVPQTLWTWKEVGHTQDAKREQQALFPEEPFPTPKPERLVQRALEIATEPGDIVLDSFAGSGTTGAVAHKMGRHWIMVELEDHYRTHIMPRMQGIIDGVDDVGITEAVEWQGGGGFRVARLGEPLLDVEEFLSSEVTYDDLAKHIHLMEFDEPLRGKVQAPLVTIRDDEALYVLFNGVMGDKRPEGGNILTWDLLEALPDLDQERTNTIYADASLLDDAELRARGIVFKQLPHDLEVL